VAPLNLLHVPIAALAIAGLVGGLIWRRRLKIAPELAALCLTILLALAANAAICGVFSHPVDRYQSRLVPLAPFAMALLIARRQRA
jgi:4-hydroxybenzoate polyprenyltransferase